MDPLDVVTALFENGSFSNGAHTITLTYAHLKTDIVSGVTLPSFNGGMLGAFGPILGGYLGTGATVIINTNSGTTFGKGDVKDVAATILHELGHAYGYIPQSGGSEIRYDGLLAADNNVKNDISIYRDCIQ